jgi:hypothetical protein
MKSYKLILWSVCVLCLGLSSCKKNEDETETETKIYLPKKIFGTIAGKGEWSVSFEYDAQNRLIKTTIPHKGYRVEFSYPEGKFYQLNYIDLDDNTVYRTIEATRSGNIVNEARTDIENSHTYPSTVVYTLNNEMAIRYEYANYTVANMYDNVGNIIKSEDDERIQTFTYDDKKGIFSNINTPAWLLWDIDVDYIWEGMYFTVNNLSEFTDTGIEKGYHANSYIYTYNPDGYPVSFKYTETYESEKEPEISVTVEYYESLN